MPCVTVEPADCTGDLGTGRTHLAVFTAQSVRADSIWLQGTGGGVAAEIQTLLETGTGLTGSHGTDTHRKQRSHLK